MRDGVSADAHRRYIAELVAAGARAPASRSSRATRGSPASAPACARRSLDELPQLVNVLSARCRSSARDRRIDVRARALRLAPLRPLRRHARAHGAVAGVGPQQARLQRDARARRRVRAQARAARGTRRSCCARRRQIVRGRVASTGADRPGAVVGLGYWGPNILRNAWELDGRPRRWPSATGMSDALARQARRYPAVASSSEFDEVLADPVDAVLHRDPDLDPSRDGRRRCSRPASTSSSRSRWPDRSRSATG